jgi:ribosomal-protein-alanine N-acetyltransferase
MSILTRLLRADGGGPGGVGIEVMRRSHVKDILAIEEQVYPKPWTHGTFVSEIDLARKGQRNYIVALIDGEVVGYGGMMFAPDEAHVTNIAVDPRRHRRGLAKRILLELVDDAVRRGFQALTLEVRVSNEAARELYRAFGFVPAGIRQRYYENSEDAIVMWAHDVDGDEYRERLARLRATLS